MKKGLLALTLAAVVAAPLSAANTVTVVPNPGPAGPNPSDYALSVNIDGTATNAFVESAHPNNESHYLIRFWINPSQLNLNPNSSVRFIAIGTESAIGQHILMFVRRDNPNPSTDQYLVNVWVRQDTGTYTFFGSRFSQFVNEAPAVDALWQQWELEFTKASAPGANNGSLRFQRMAGYNGAGPAFQQTNHDTDTIDVDNFRAGTLATIAGIGSGSLLFDEFESYR